MLGLALGLALALTPGCKASSGEVCRCASDCRDGLVCVVGNSDVLSPGECGDSDKVGHCVDDDSLSNLEGGLGDMPIFDDLPSKRDIGGVEGDTTTTDTTTTDTTTTDTTDTGTDTTTDTGTDTTTDTGTDTTTDTGTDTSTDTGSTT